MLIGGNEGAAACRASSAGSDTDCEQSRPGAANTKRALPGKWNDISIKRVVHLCNFGNSEGSCSNLFECFA